VRQAIGAAFFGDIPLKLAAQDSDVGIAPDRPFAVFELSLADAFDDEVDVHAVFIRCRHVAEGGPFAPPKVWNVTRRGVGVNLAGGEDACGVVGNGFTPSLTLRVPFC